jgi:Ca2+:H+ antiporter
MAGRLDVVAMARLVMAWAAVAAFQLSGDGWLVDLASPVHLGALLAALLAVIVWCAFAVVEEAEDLAVLLGEPLGTLVLTLAIVTIEVALIAAVMLGAHAGPTLGRDTMFAVLMIVLNGVVGLALLLGGLRHREQAYNLQGAVAYLSIIMPLSVIALVLPSYTASTSDQTLSTAQAVTFGLFTVLLYGVFLAVQTVRHRHFFVEPAAAGGMRDPRPPAPAREVARHTALLLLTLVPILLLAKPLAKLVNHGIDALGAPPALGGVLIAMIVFMPEGLSALRAALANQLQRAVNLCLGAAASTIGLTVPAILAVGLLTGQQIVLGLDPAGVVLLAVTLALSILTFGGPRTTILEGAVHLVMFFVYLVLIFSP